MLQDVEENRISPFVKKLAAKLAKTTENEVRTLPPTTPASIREALLYDLLYFSVAAKLFNSDFTISEMVRKDAGVLFLEFKMQEVISRIIYPANLATKTLRNTKFGGITKRMKHFNDIFVE